MKSFLKRYSSSFIFAGCYGIYFVVLYVPSKNLENLSAQGGLFLHQLFGASKVGDLVADILFVLLVLPSIAPLFLSMIFFPQFHGAHPVAVLVTGLLFYFLLGLLIQKCFSYFLKKIRGHNT